MLSSSRIESLSQNNENARKCNAVYTFIRDDLLSHHNWNFSRKEASLARLDETPVTSDWAYIYQLPTDCIRVIKQEDNYPFAIFEDKLYNNDSSSKIQYASLVTDPVQFPQYFAYALSTRIAATLAYGITQNATLAEGMLKVASSAIKEAMWTDSQEGDGVSVIQGSFLTSRQG